jgi:hypothetical protein
LLVRGNKRIGHFRSAQKVDNPAGSNPPLRSAHQLPISGEYTEIIDTDADR